MSLVIPKNFIKNRVSPSTNELEFIYNWCVKTKPKKILEFGCGSTTCALFQGASVDNTIDLYVAMEHWVPSIQNVIDTMPSIKIIKTIWYDIPIEKYDLIFVDSSAGYPPGGDGLYRHEAVIYGERLLNTGGYIMIHDWHGRSGKQSKAYLENTKNNFKLVDSLTDKTGVGIYSKL